MKTSFILLFLLTASVSASSQSLRQRLDLLDTAFAQSNHPKVLQLAAGLYDEVVNGKDDTLAVEFLSTVGSAHYHNREYEKALSYFSLAAARALDKLEAGDYRYPLAQFNQASCLKELGRYTEAEPLFLSSLPPLAPVFGQSSVQYTRCFYTLAMMYIDMDRFTEAESMCAAAVHFYKETLGQTSDDYLGALGAMGVIYMGQSKYDKAEEVFLSLKTYHESQPSPHKETLQVLENNLGDLYRHSGDYSRAATHLQNAVQMATPGSDAQASSLNNLALVLKATGDYAAAEAAYKQSIQVYISLNKKDHPEITNPVNNLGELYRTMGRLQEAVYAFEEVIILRKKWLGINHPNYANALNNLALVEFSIGRYDSAAVHLQQCLSAYKTTLGEKDKYYANALNNLASVYKAQGNLTAAEETYKQCLRIYKAGYGETSDKYGNYLGGLAGTYREMKRYDEAISLILQSLTILRNKLGTAHYDYVETVYGLAETFREAGRLTEAAQYYLEAVNGYLLLIQKYFPYLSENDKTQFYHNLSNVFESYHFFAQEQYNLNKGQLPPGLTGRLYDNQLALKSLLLRESGQLHNLVAASNNDSVKQLFRRWQQLRENIVQYYRLSPDELAEKNISLAVLELRTNEAEQLLARAVQATGNTAPDAAIAAHSQARQWQQVRDALAPGEYAVEIFRSMYYSRDGLSDSVIYTALVLDKKSTAPRYVPLHAGNDLEAAVLPAYRLAIKSKLKDETSYAAFWNPVKAATPAATRIWLSPDGVYQLINPYTLRNPATGRYLVDETELRLLGNTGEIIRKPSADTARSAVLISYPDFGLATTPSAAITTRIPGFPNIGELPGTRIEADSIGQILSKNGYSITDYRRSKASEETVKALASPGVLHIATHGFFLKNIRDDKQKVFGMQAAAVRQNPLLRSGIILAGAAAIARDTVVNLSGDDGILTAWEAAGLNLNGTGLVVLSACETGLGEWKNGQGVFGLQRSFMVAGARSVIMSLWVIDDYATQELMTHFYRSWLANPGKDGKQKAFREAQLALRQKYPEPYYWGSFILVGE